MRQYEVFKKYEADRWYEKQNIWTKRSDVVNYN